MNNCVPILVYYKVRGKLQPIRNLLAYLGQPFVEVHWGDEQQNRSLPQNIKDALRTVKVEKNFLPLLVFEGMLLYDIYPIMAYLCRRFDRDDLLGRDVKQRTRLQEILEIYLLKETASMIELFRLSEACADKEEEGIILEKKTSFQLLMNDSGYVREICIYLQRQKNREAFTLGTLTILDFLFLQTCHYMLGMFNNIDEHKNCHLLNKLKELFSGKAVEFPQDAKHLDTARAFVAFMTALPFYEDNKAYLENFSIVCSAFPPKRAAGLRKLWAYEKAFVK